MYVHKLQLHTAVHEPQIEATVRPWFCECERPFD